MKHRASPTFWQCYEKLPGSTQRLADKNFQLLKENPEHPSLRFKQIGRFRSARVGLMYRALGVHTEDVILWIWIGNHDEYDRILKSQ